MMTPGTEKTVPVLYRCPISLELMKDPVTLCTGQTYDRNSIEPWLEAGHATCPATMQQLPSLELLPNHTLRRVIEGWCTGQSSKSMVRISSSKPPAVDPEAILSLLQDVERSADPLSPLKKLRSLTCDNEKSRRCIRNCGGVPILSSILSSEKRMGDEVVEERMPSSFEACEESLAILASVSLSCDNELKGCDGTSLSISLARFLRSGSLDMKVNAITVFAAIVAQDNVQCAPHDLLTILESMGKLLREDLYPRAFKATLRALLALCNDHRNRVLVVEAGIASALIELLPEFQKANAEHALGVLELLCTDSKGRAAIVDHDLAMAVFVSLFHTISVLATEHIVSILWNVCKASKKALVTAQEAGVFTQLLLLLQMECAPETREKCRELLKKVKTGWKEASCDPNFILPSIRTM